MEYYLAVKNSGIRKFEGKWLKLDANQPERDNTDPERHTWHVLTSGY